MSREGVDFEYNFVWEHENAPAEQGDELAVRILHFLGYCDGQPDTKEASEWLGKRIAEHDAALLASRPQPEATTDARELDWENVFAILDFYEEREHDHNHVYNIQAARGFLKGRKARLASAREQGEAEVKGLRLDLGLARLTIDQRIAQIKQAETRIAELEAVERKVEKLWAALKAMVTAFDPYGTGGDAYHNHAEAITMAHAALATPAEGTTREGESK
jgi:hypothetical protein